MKIPCLRFIEEKNRYKNVFDNYTSDVHSAVVNAWLFEDLPTREIDSTILNLNSDYSHGYESMNILHYLGINAEFKNEFKEKFNDMDLKCIIREFESCATNDYDELIHIFKLLDDEMINLNLFESDILSLSITQDTLDKISAALNSGENIILNGVPGTGKTHLATIFSEEAMCEDGYILTTATSDWTTFDTIGGLMPNNDGELVFHEGKFLQAIRENKWLIIDEINRADIDKAFGQLFTVLSKQNVELPYFIKNNDDELFSIKIKVWDKHYSTYNDDDATYYIGKNWRIIATMNSYDKNSLFDLSYAFMRRFNFIEIDVPKNFSDLIKIWENDGEIKNFIESSKNFIPKLEILYSINHENESIDINRQLGPSIFLDSIKYLHHRMDLEDNDEYDDKIFSEVVNSFVIPQFEGLSKEKLDELKNFFVKEIFEDENNIDLFLDKINELKPFY